MKLKIVKEDKHSLEIEVQGESVGFVNALKEELWEDKNVDEAAYIKEHPYLGEPKIYVKVNRGDPRTALKKAVKRLLDKTKDFEENFERTLKK